MKKYNYTKFILTKESWDNAGVPYGMRDLIDLAVECKTPIPVNQLEGLYSAEEITAFNKQRGLRNYED